LVYNFIGKNFFLIYQGKFKKIKKFLGIIGYMAIFGVKLTTQANTLLNYLDVNLKYPKLVVACLYYYHLTTSFPIIYYIGRAEFFNLVVPKNKPVPIWLF